MSFVGNTSGFIRMNVTGLREAISGIDSALREWPNTKTQVIREGAIFFFQDAQKNAHVITGKTRASIHIEVINQNQGIISASAGMPFEEKRGGTRVDTGTPHKTFTEAGKRTAAAWPAMIRRDFDALLARHRTR